MPEVIGPNTETLGADAIYNISHQGYGTVDTDVECAPADEGFSPIYGGRGGFIAFLCGFRQGAIGVALARRQSAWTCGVRRIAHPSNKY